MSSSPLPARLRALDGLLRHYNGGKPKKCAPLVDWLPGAASTCTKVETYIERVIIVYPTPIHMNQVSMVTPQLETLRLLWPTRLAQLITTLRLETSVIPDMHRIADRLQSLSEQGGGMRSGAIGHELERLRTAWRRAAQPAPAGSQKTKKATSAGLTRSAQQPLPLPRPRPALPSTPERVIPLSQLTVWTTGAKCGVCRSKLLDVVCVVCLRHVCPRCGTCALTCEARILRRERASFPAFRESQAGFIPEDEWIIRKRAMKEGVGRAIDFEV